MEWLFELLRNPDSVPHAVLVLSLVSALGLILGSIKVGGITLGIAGVLFTGLFFGHFRITINPSVLDFVRDFGLILFVYTIGVQVGPSFASSLRKQGLPLNLMAAAIVVLGVGVTFLLVKFGKIEMPVAVGLFSGATTNTPSLGAAQQALKELKGLPPDVSKLPALGYAVAYPFGVLGIILSMGLIRRVFKIDVDAEQKAVLKGTDFRGREFSILNIEIQNPKADGIPLQSLPGIDQPECVVSRVYHEGVVKIAAPEMLIHRGDIILAVGPKESVEQLCISVGIKSKVDLRSLPGPITSRRVVVTQPNILGKTIRSLDLYHRYGVTVTRVIRTEIEFTPTPDFRIQFADRVVLVGTPQAIANLEKEFGNSVKTLDHPRMVPVFVGIALGVFFGSIPMYFPGTPAPVKLGMAGGPLIVAILLSRLGHFRSLVWYMPASANFMLREFGILLFLACVGLKAGDRFVATLVEGQGFYWMACAALITIVPLLIVGFFARTVLKTNYMTVCGLLAGSMTDPPALAFANTMTRSETPSVSYATVYPLTMLLRVICAQLIVFFMLQ